MTTTTPSHDRPLAGVPVGGVPAQRPAPAGPTPSPGTAPLRPATAAPTAVAVPLPRQRPVALPTPRRRPTLAVPRRWWAATADGLAAGLAVCTVGAAGVVVALSSMAPPPEPAAPTVPPASVSPNVSVPGRVLSRVSDGTWQIGVDIEPGTYTSAGAVDGATCSHTLRTARTGGLTTASDVEPGRATIDLTEADGWFETSGCATWTRVA